MSPAEIHRLLLDRFGDAVILGFDDAGLDPGAEVAPARIAEVGEFLLADERCQFNHLNDLTGVDYLELDPKKAKKFDYPPHLEVVYHLSSFTLKHRFKLRVKLPRWKNDQPGELPEIPTVSGVWKIADWHEREAYDLMGIHFVGHSNLRRILCPEDWTGHPLRKDYEFPLEYHGIRGK